MKQFVLKNYSRIGENMKKEEIKKASCFAFDVYEQWKGCDSLVTELKNIIKVMLPEDEENARKMLTEGVTIEEEKFVPWLTSANMMKNAEEEDCGEYFFINEEDKDFIPFFDDIISASKITEKRNNKDKIYINKDYTSRVSLGFTDSVRLKDYSWKNKILILPETTYNYITNYEKVVEVKNSEGDIIDVNIEKVDLEEVKKIEHTAFDGFGVFNSTGEYAKKLDKQFGRKIDFTIFRSYPLAVKGLVVRFDFQQYISDNFVENNEYIKYENGSYYAKDCFGKWINLSNVDLILNETQVKFIKFWKGQSLEDVYSYIETKYSDYAKLLYSMYISKTNKAELPNYTRANYQLLNALSLTPAEMKELYRKDIKDFEDMIINKNADKVKIFMGSLANKEEELTPGTKVHELILSSDRFFDASFVKNTISRLTKKKVEELAGGKPYVKGNYKFMGCDPIAYMNFLMNREIKGVLNAGETYVNNEVGQRVLARNPLATFKEVRKTNLVSSDLIRRYTGEDYSNEIIFYNQVDNTAACQSGADFDGDQSLVIDNEIIYNSVIDTDYDFLNVNDGEKADAVPFTNKNVIDSFIGARGNLIGKLSLFMAKVNTYNQDIAYIDTKENFVSRKAIKKAVESKNGVKTTIENTKNKMKSFKESKDWEKYNEAKEKLAKYRKEKTDEFINACLEKNVLTDMSALSENEIKSIISKRFIDSRKISYYNLYLTQINIDAPKNLVKATKKQERYLNNSLNVVEELHLPHKVLELSTNQAQYNVRFLQFEKEGSVDYNNKSAINRMFDEINENLLSKMSTNHSDNKKLCLKFIDKIKGTEINKELFSCISEIYNIYNKCNRAVESYKRNIFFAEKSGNLELINTCNNLITENKDNCDREIFEKLSKYEDSKYLSQKANALIELELSSSFIIRYFYDVLIAAVKEEVAEISAYEKDEDGTIELFHKKYTKKNAVIKEVKIDKVEQAKREMKLGTMFMISCRATNSADIKATTFIAKNDCLYTIDGEIIGEIFSNSTYQNEQVFEAFTTQANAKSFRIYYRK